MTKKEMFVEIRKAVSANDEMVAFIDRQIELLDRKSSAERKPTATQKENEGFKTDILVALSGADEPMNIKTLQTVVPSIAKLSNQRVSHLLKALVDSGQVVKAYVKKVPVFSIA